MIERYNKEELESLYCLNINSKSVQRDIDRKKDFFQVLFSEKHYKDIKNQYNHYIDFEDLPIEINNIFNHHYFIAVYKTSFFDLIDRFEFFMTIFNNLNYGIETINVKKLIIIELLKEYKIFFELEEFEIAIIDFLYKLNQYLIESNIYLETELNEVIKFINNNFKDKINNVAGFPFNLIDVSIQEDIEEELHELKIQDLNVDEIVVTILGHSHKNKNLVYNLFKDYGFNPKNINIIDYEDVSKTRIDRLFHETRINYILVGPTPHSAKGIGSASSVPVYLKENTLKDTVIDLKDSNGNYSISKTNLTKAIEDILRLVKLSQV